jgi:hypothetical protein
MEVKHYYSDYYWEEGRPHGRGPHSDPEGLHFKIVTDPYFKWITVEKYQGDLFDGIVYDSKIFDFRNLKLINQTAWEKVSCGQERCLIRNQDDRIILFEEYVFEGNWCRQCRTTSVHGIPISLQKIYYTELGDPVNGVALFDNHNHVVMYKLYDTDPQSGEFQNVVREQWNMKDGGDLNLFQRGKDIT